jgi:quercetin dioxygenase-like cupin family protein
MKVIRRGSEMSEASGPLGGAFVGTVLQKPLNVNVTPQAVEVIFVKFAPGSHTHWHIHGGGQVLYLVDGQGCVQTESGETVFVDTGDTVIAPPGEKHWHGATKIAASGAVYMACSFGEEQWMEAPEDGSLGDNSLDHSA